MIVSHPIPRRAWGSWCRLTPSDRHWSPARPRVKHYPKTQLLLLTDQSVERWHINFSVQRDRTICLRDASSWGSFYPHYRCTPMNFSRACILFKAHNVLGCPKGHTSAQLYRHVLRTTEELLEEYITSDRQDRMLLHMASAERPMIPCPQERVELRAGHREAEPSQTPHRAANGQSVSPQLAPQQLYRHKAGRTHRSVTIFVARLPKSRRRTEHHSLVDGVLWSAWGTPGPLVVSTGPSHHPTELVHLCGLPEYRSRHGPATRFIIDIS
ncbi:hypothetical protein BDW22DRAFT_805281 [Trametopsis cervina]|nr:hypothetical protein BDW22DRAFT_805281 [Trametopsis cervina]